MDGEAKDGPWAWRTALPVSVLAHLLVAALIAFPISLPLPPPEAEQAVDVELVPPPAPKPEPEKPAAQPPKPAPEPAAEQPPKSAEQPPTSAVPATPANRQVLNPVFRFGEKDAGPRKKLDGDSAEDGGALAKATADPAAPQKTVTEPAETDAASEAGAAKPAPKTPAAPLGTGDVPASPTVLGARGGPQSVPEPHETTVATREPGLLQADKTPAPKPARAARAPAGPKLQEAKQLFSRAPTNSLVATSAMDGVTRKVRGGRLCVTELREQLLRTSPPYFPELLPSYPLNAGVVLEVSKAAFRVDGQWVNLSFRCEVDADATQVVGFAFRVGDRLDRAELARRGLPVE